jgi:hypothetical protein
VIGRRKQTKKERKKYNSKIGLKQKICKQMIEYFALKLKLFIALDIFKGIFELNSKIANSFSKINRNYKY